MIEYITLKKRSVQSQINIGMGRSHQGLIDRLYEKRACNFHSYCTVGKILIMATNVWEGQMEAVQFACQCHSSACWSIGGCFLA